MTSNNQLYVLDSFALLALFQDEPGGLRVRELIQGAMRGLNQLAMAVVNMGEVFYKTVRERSEDRADEVLSIMNQFPIETFDIDWDLALSAARLKGAHKMSYADCIAAALAMRLHATVVTGDPEFHLVENLVSVEWLPAPR